MTYKHHFFQAQDWCIPKSKKSGEGNKRFVWMSKELMDKVKGKKKVHRMWEEGLSTWEECRNAVRSCWDVMRKAKAILELNLAKEEVKDNKKDVF